MILIVIAWFFAYDGTASHARYPSCDMAREHRKADTRDVICIEETRDEHR